MPSQIELAPSAAVQFEAKGTVWNGRVGFRDTARCPEVRALLSDPARTVFATNHPGVQLDCRQRAG